MLGSRVYMRKREEVENTPNTVTSNFSIKTHPVEVLFDSVATHSFIAAGLVEA